MIFAVTTTASTNSDSMDGSSLRTQLGNVTIELDDNTAGIGGNVTVKRIGGNDSVGVSTAAASSVTLNLSTLTSNDSFVDNGTTVYYEVLVSGVTLAGVAGDESARARLVDFDASGFQYKSDDTTPATSVTALRLPGKTTVE